MAQSPPSQNRPSAVERHAPASPPSKRLEKPRDRIKLPELEASTSPPGLAYLDESVKSPTNTDESLSPIAPVDRTRNLLERLSPSKTKSDDDKASTIRGAKSQDDHGVEFPKRGRGDAETDSMYSTSSRGRAKSGVSLERSLSSPYESTSSPALSGSTYPTSVGSSVIDRLKVQNSLHPTRSNTSPTLSRGDDPKDQPTTRRRTEKQCVKCGKRITDGKWISVDSSESAKATVLCEYDWKMLYLPKCRRCDKPIEGQAVGSSDGQIKGKYHRGCFNCTSCQVCVLPPTH